MSAVRCAFGLPSGNRCRLICRGSSSLCPLHQPASLYVFPPAVPSTAHFTIEDIGALHSADPSQIVNALARLQLVTNVEHCDAILSMNLLDRLVQLLDERFGEFIRFRAAWVLTNMAALEDNNGCFAIVDGGGLRPLLVAVKSVNDNLCLQSLWCLCNLAGSDLAIRDEVAAQWHLMPRIAALNLEAKTEAVRLFMNLANHLSAENSTAAVAEFLPLLAHDDTALSPTLKRIIVNVIDTLWKRFGAESIRTAFQNKRSVEYLLASVENSKYEVLGKKTLDFVNDILSSDAHDVIRVLLDAGLVALLKRLLEDERFEKRDILLILSNVAAEDVSEVLKYDGLLKSVSGWLKWSFDECKDVIWIFSNLLNNATPTQVAEIIRLVPNLHLRLQILMIAEGHDDCQNLLVQALENLLKKGGEAAVRAMLLTPVAMIVAEGSRNAEASATATGLLNWWVTKMRD